MFRSPLVPASGSRPGWIALGGVLGVMSLSLLQAQTAPAQQAEAAPARVFGSDAGMVLNFIKPDKTADFEAVIGKLKEALGKSTNPEHKQQAASWKVFKSAEPAAGGNVLYVFVIDPSVRDADYTVAKILSEAFPPTEVNELFTQYAEAFASGQNFINMTLVSDLGM